MKRLLIVGLLGLSLCLLNSKITAEERFSIVTAGIAPISYEEDGTLKGIGTDLVVEAFTRLGFSFDIRIYPGARALNMLQEGTADALFAVAKTPERERFATYPETPIIEQPIALFVRQNSTIQFDGDMKSLIPYSIGILRGGRFSPEFEAAIKNRLFPKLEEVNLYRQNILKLVNQRIDIVVGPRLSVRFAAKELGHQEAIKELQPALTASSPSYLAFSKHGKAASLVMQFDEVLKAMHQDGAYDRIIQSYLE